MLATGRRARTSAAPAATLLPAAPQRACAPPQHSPCFPQSQPPPAEYAPQEHLWRAFRPSACRSASQPSPAALEQPGSADTARQNCYKNSMREAALGSAGASHPAARERLARTTREGHAPAAALSNCIVPVRGRSPPSLPPVSPGRSLCSPAAQVQKRRFSTRCMMRKRTLQRAGGAPARAPAENPPPSDAFRTPAALCGRSVRCRR